MSDISNGTHVDDSHCPTSFNYGHVGENILDTSDSNVIHEQRATNYGETSRVTLNEVGSSDHFSTQDQVADNIFYDAAGSLFNRPLILTKEFKSPFDIRYKTDYFPRGGKYAGIPQTPRYLLTVDGDLEAVIKFPKGYIIPQNPENYLLEVALLTVPRVNQHYMHGNKFQLDHKDVNVLDENPFFIPTTLNHFIEGEMRVKLVITRTHKDELTNKTSLPLFGDQTPAGWTANCKSVEDLRDTYELNHARVAFSLGYKDSNNQFIRFTNTTVISNVIIEKEKSKPADNITCPNCSHCFSIKEQKYKGRKRSAPSSNATEKKRSS